MLEEAAGTRMYESKRSSAQKTIEKKDNKLKEIEVVSTRSNSIHNLRTHPLVCQKTWPKDLSAVSKNWSWYQSLIAFYFHHVFSK